MLAPFKYRIDTWNLCVQEAEFVEARQKNAASCKGGSKELAPGKIWPRFESQLATKTTENLPSIIGVSGINFHRFIKKRAGLWFPAPEIPTLGLRLKAEPHAHLYIPPRVQLAPATPQFTPPATIPTLWLIKLTCPS